MTDHFALLVDELHRLKQQKAAMRAAAKSPAKPVLFRKALPPPPPKPNFRAELDGILNKALSLHGEGKATAFQVAKLENQVEAVRAQLIARGLL